MLLGVALPSVFAIAPTRLSEFGALTFSWWSGVGIAVIVGMSAALLSVGLARRPALLTGVGVVSAAAYCALLLVWFVGWSGATIPATTGTGLELWVVFVPQNIACVFVMVGRLMPAVGTVIVAGGLSLGVTVAASGQGEWSDVVDAGWLLALVCLYLVIARSVIAGARRFDEERAAAAVDAASRLHDHSRRAEQRRLDAMVHDRLIAILIALRPGPLSLAGERAITGVLDEIADWNVEPRSGRLRLRAAEVMQRLRLSLDEIGDDVESVIDVSGDYEYPAEAADAIIDAVCEAVRNVHRHAGPDASCAVMCEMGDDAITAIVIDDGVGFEPRAVPANRIGVTFGILERMHVLDGGDGRVDSEPGAGTRVELSWAAPGGDR